MIMRLVRLLAVGKSLVGLQEADGRYRTTRKRLLPNFPASKNPFRATARPALNMAPEAELPGLSDPEQDAAAQAPVPAEPVSSGSVGLMRFSVRRIWNRWLGARGGKRPQSQQQAELTLQHVKVVRNDLSHYDSEPAVRKPLGAVVQEKQKQLQLTPRPAGVLPGFEVEPKASFLTGRRG